MQQAARFLRRFLFGGDMLLTISIPPEENDPDWLEVWELSGEVTGVTSGKHTKFAMENGHL